MFILIFTRLNLRPWSFGSKEGMDKEGRRAIIVGGQEESGRIKELINRSRDHIDIIGTVSPSDGLLANTDANLGYVDQLHDIVRVHHIREIIFSAQDVPFSTFTSAMATLGPGLRYMLAASATMNIVGSMNKDTEGESYAIRIDFKLSHAASKRAKRIFDIISSMIILVLSPLLYFFINPKKYLWGNIWLVLSGKRTWISYHPIDPMISSLPALRPGILSPEDPESTLSRRLEHIHYVYARDYHWTTDLSLLSAKMKKLGQNPLAYARQSN